MVKTQTTHYYSLNNKLLSVVVKKKNVKAKKKKKSVLAGGHIISWTMYSCWIPVCPVGTYLPIMTSGHTLLQYTALVTFFTCLSLLPSFSLYKRVCQSNRCNNENEWHQIHENIIRKTSTKYTTPSTNYGIETLLSQLKYVLEQSVALKQLNAIILFFPLVS